ncbi:MarR family winged helix-turn-helix transcriptional regulator [Sinorhizobium chiapasense]|uniref:MarR family winged helix-turn-helix transcriptional regulator n=1 Tax=Sinorhizobium chiapasense TaxID=501572 RepID=A0ABZ2BEC1_9HYPH
MTKDDIGVWDVCTNTALRRASRQLSQLYDDVLAASGLKITQFSLLSQIWRSGDASLKTLADLMVMDLSALGHTLKPLVRDGYVELVPDRNDRRVKRVQLTPLGLRKQEEALALWTEAQARFDKSYGKAQSEALRKDLNLIAASSFADTYRSG